MALMGEELYRAFFAGYTAKQWGSRSESAAGLDPQAAAGALRLQRQLFRPSWQAIAARRLHGDRREDFRGAGHRAAAGLPFRGPRRALRAYRLQRPIRPLLQLRFRPPRLSHARFRDIRRERRSSGHGGAELLRSRVPFTRIRTQLFRAVGEKDVFDTTICYRDSRALAGARDIPYYPIRLVDEQKMLADYIARCARDAGRQLVAASAPIAISTWT